MPGFGELFIPKLRENDFCAANKASPDTHAGASGVRTNEARLPRVCRNYWQVPAPMPALQALGPMERGVTALLDTNLAFSGQDGFNRWAEQPANCRQFTVMNPRTKILFSLVVLALVCLSTLALCGYPAIAIKGFVLGAALGMATVGIALYPTKRCKRPIVRREILMAASVCLIAGAALLCLSVFGHQGLLALLLSHPFGHSGIALASGSVVLSESDLTEFKRILNEMRPYGNALRNLPEQLQTLKQENDSLRADVNRIRKSSIGNASGTGVRWVGDKPFVTDDCARALTSVFVLDCSRITNALERMVPDEASRQRVLATANATLGVEFKAAMTSTEIPLPAVYVPQVVELVYKYGQARQYATVFPLGSGTVKLPRLKAGEDDFGYLGAGTAGMSQAVPEKKVTAEIVTFTANKAGGIIRLPFELEEDTFIPIGQFLARYIARQLAKLEDKTLFLADGSPTYAGQTGVGPYCAANPTYLLQLAAGKTKPSDATVQDFRNLRSKVSAAILAGGFDAAYYLSPTFEPMLRGFNQYPNFVIFEYVNGQPRFDGWPVRWVGVSQAFSTGAAASSYLAFFGALSYWYLGERGAPRVEVSRDVFFTTDELAMRALERIDVEALGIDAMATLQTAAA